MTSFDTLCERRWSVSVCSTVCSRLWCVSGSWQADCTEPLRHIVQDRLYQSIQYESSCTDAYLPGHGHQVWCLFITFFVSILLHLVTAEIWWSLFYLIYLCYIAWWRAGAVGKALDLQSTGRGFNSYSGQKLRNNLRQVVHTYVPLSPSSITWYRPRDSDALRWAGLAESNDSLLPGWWLIIIIIK